MRILVLLGHKVVNGESPWSISFLLKYAPEGAKIDWLGVHSRLGESPLELFLFSFFQTLEALSKAKNYDAILSMNVYGGLLFSLFRSLLKIESPVHVILDSSSLPFIASTPMLKIMRFTASSITKIICYTRLQRDFWNNRVASSIATFFPLGVDTKKYFPTMESSDYIFSCGRTARDFPTLISAAKTDNYWFIIVTGKDSKTGKTGIGGIPIPKNVKVYFEIPSSQYDTLLSKSKFVILPLKNVPYECGLSVLLHSMSMGKTVIVTRTASTVDYVVDGETGIFVQPYDINDMREKIRYLLENPKKLDEIGVKGRMAAESLFSEQIMAKNFAKVLTSVRYEENTSSERALI